MIALILLLGAPLLAVAEGIPQAAPQVKEVRQVMGTFGEVQAWAADRHLAQAAADSAFAVFTRVDSLMSTWNGNSALSRFNAAPTGQWQPLDPQLLALLETSCALADLSAQAFDPTILPLVILWGFRGGQPVVPAADTIEQMLGRVDMSQLEISHHCARFRQPQMALDLGGIAKGFALDRAAAAMKAAGAEAGVLDLGGNLLIFGQPMVREIAIIDPLQPDLWAISLPLANQAIATSGQYERFLVIDGKSYGHILDPRTGWPVPQGRSATVIASTATIADGLATALLVMGLPSGLAMIEELDGVEAVFIDAEGVHTSSGLAAVAILREDKPK